MASSRVVARPNGRTWLGNALWAPYSIAAIASGAAWMGGLWASALPVTLFKPFEKFQMLWVQPGVAVPLAKEKMHKETANVVLPAEEFPSNRLPWLALAERGVEAREVDIRAAADAEARIVVLLVDERPDIANEGLAIIERWHGEMMRTSQPRRFLIRVVRSACSSARSPLSRTSLPACLCANSIGTSARMSSMSAADRSAIFSRASVFA